MLRPELEKMYGYTHAVQIGNELKMSEAVSMDEKGNLTGSWFGVKELALPGQLIEIELEAYKVH